jgi:hypothetical protein
MLYGDLRSLDTKSFRCKDDPDCADIESLLQAPKLRADVVARIAVSLAETYETVYAALADSANGYAEQPGFSTALEHTPENVRLILGVLA